MKKCIMVIIALLYSFLCADMLFAAANTWTQRADFGGGVFTGGVGFSIGVKGYIATGYNGSYSNALWQYDPTADSWTQKANLGCSNSTSSSCSGIAAARMNATGFSIGTKGYVGLGASGTTTFYNDFYEYDPTTNAWTQKANLGCSNSTSSSCSGIAAKRGGAVGFAIGTKGYIGTGASVNAFFVATYYQDFYEYDPTTNIWTKKGNFSGSNSSRGGGTGFSIGSKGYIGLGTYGSSSSNLLQDFYEYNPTTDLWTRKANLGCSNNTSASCSGIAPVRGGAAGFSIGNKGYVGIGGYYASSSDNAYYNDFYEYDPTTNIWTQKANLGCSNSTDASCSGIAEKRYNGVGFSIGSRGYIGTGYNSSLSPNKLADFYEYEPATMPSPLYGAFTGNGIWKWDGNRWSQITVNTPNSMVSMGTNLYGAFPNGIWKWDGSTWTNVTSSNTPQYMTATATILYAAFSGFGVWQWNGSTWTQIDQNNANPYFMTVAAASGSTLYGAFDAVLDIWKGIWAWNGSSWTRITPNKPNLIAANSTILYGAFGNGIWQWNGSIWSNVTPNTPQSMVASDTNLYGGFSNGIWKWNGSTWTQLASTTPLSMEIYGTNLFAAFQNGIWQWDGTFWIQITTSTPASIKVVN